MGQLRFTTVLLSTILFTTVAASSQNNISLASNLTRPGTPAPLTCQQAAAILAQQLLEFPRPQQWHWIIVCDDAAWRQFLMQRDSAQQPSSEETIYASTDLAAHLTLLRGTTLVQPDNPLATPEHVIAHELAHIALNTTDENRAEAQAVLWLEKRDQAYFSLLNEGLTMQRRRGQSISRTQSSSSSDTKQDAASGRESTQGQLIQNQ